MGVESGPSGAEAAVPTGAASVSGPALSFRGSAFEVAPVRISPMVNEGPFRGSLEGFRPMSVLDKPIDNKGGSSVPVEGLDAGAAVAEAERIFALVRISPVGAGTSIVENPLGEGQAMAEPRYQLDIYRQEPAPERIVLNPVRRPAVEAQDSIIEAKYRILPEVEEKKQASPHVSGVSAHPSGLPAPAQKSRAVEIFAEKVRKSASPQVEAEQAEITRRRFVLDEGALGRIVTEIKEAVTKASRLADEQGIKLTGFLVRRFLPAQHPGNESEAVKIRGGSRPDGSIPERSEAIGSHGEYESGAEAEKRSVKEAYEKPPVKVRKEGEGLPIRKEDVARVFKYEAVKPQLVEEVSLTAVKKEVRTAPRIEDYPGVAKVLAPEIG